MGSAVAAGPISHIRDPIVYLLFVDESGTHGAPAHAFVLGGIALHEDDTVRLQRNLDELVIRHLGHTPVNLEEYELHANELRNAKKPKGTPSSKVSVWAPVPRQDRARLLAAAYELLGSFEPQHQQQRHWLFGVVLDSHFRRDDPQVDRERFAYEVLLNKFDLMLKRLRVDHQQSNRGLVVHDRRVVAEQDIQSWVTGWRVAAGSVGQLRNLADVPLFTDSRATRLVQVADLVAYALYRRYRPDPDRQYFDAIWPYFHRDDDGRPHGLVHFTPDFGRGSCRCESCVARS